MAKLTQKQELFCREYLVDYNATQAALRAGYSSKTAHSIGHENLKKPEIKDVVNKFLEDEYTLIGLNHKRILREIISIAFNYEVGSSVRLKALELLIELSNFSDDSKKSSKSTQRILSSIRSLKR